MTPPPLSPAPPPPCIGFCGKLPDRGDFVRRNLPQALADCWEAWLDAGLTAGRTALDPASPALLMPALLMNAPIWRFAASLPCAGDKGLAGVMLPSFDRVGRHYPLSIIAVLDSPGAATAAALWSQHWFYDLERLALAALLGDLSFAQFAARLASASGPGRPGLPPPGAASRRGASPLGPLPLLSALIGRVSGPRPAAFSLWWRDAPGDGQGDTQGDVQGDGREFCLMFPGLPGPDDFRRLLTPAPDPLARPPSRDASSMAGQSKADPGGSAAQTGRDAV